MYKYTDEELIESIKAKAKELGRTPRSKEVKHLFIICSRFGSWNRALKLAGLNPIQHKGSEKYYIGLIKKWHREHGKAPTKQDFFNDPSLPQPGSIVNKLKLSWNEIIQKIGLDPDIKINPKYLTNDELIKLFKEDYERIKPKKIDEFNQKKMKSPNVEYIEKRLNMTYNEMKKMLGIDDINISKYSDDEIIIELKRVKKLLGHAPSTTEFEKHSCMATMAIKNHFGSWNNGLKRAGLKIKNITPEVVKESNEELLQMYNSFSIEIGKGETGATVQDLDSSDEIYNFGVFDTRFGGINEMRKLVGFKVTSTNAKKLYTKEQLRTLLLKEKEKLKRRLNFKEINNNKNLPTSRTVLRYFNKTSIAKMWEEIES